MPDTLSLSAGVSLGLLAGIVSGVCYLVANGMAWPKNERENRRCITSSQDDGVCRSCGGDKHGGALPCICYPHKPVKFETGAWFLQQVHRAISVMPWSVSTDKLEQIDEECDGFDVPGPSNATRGELKKIREFLETISAKLAGGPLEGTRVAPLYDHPAYYESDNSYSNSNPSPRSVVSIPPSEDCTPIQPSLDGDTTQVIQTNESHDLPPETPTLPAEILEVLGEAKTKAEVYAPKIRDEISERWGKIVVEGLNKDLVQKLMENIHFPENFKLLKAPELNPEIATVLSESTKNRDRRLEKAQNHLGKGIAAVSNLMGNLIEGDVDKTIIIKKLSETGQLLLDLHCQNTFNRRKLIMYSLDKKFSNMVQGVQRDSFLFGENLGEKIKASKTAERSGLQVKRIFEPQPSTSFHSNQPPTRQGNSKAPPRTREQRGRWAGARNQASSRTTRRAPVKNDRYRTNNNKPHPRR